MKLALNSEPTLFDENLKQVRDKNAKKQSCVRLLGKPSTLMSTTLGEGCFWLFRFCAAQEISPGLSSLDYTVGCIIRLASRRTNDGPQTAFGIHRSNARRRSM